MLVLLDLSAASGSYMQKRDRTVNILFFKIWLCMIWRTSRFGVGSFPLCTGLIGAICRQHGIDNQLYVDDTHVYLIFNVANDNDQKMDLNANVTMMIMLPWW